MRPPVFGGRVEALIVALLTLCLGTWLVSEFPRPGGRGPSAPHVARVALSLALGQAVLMAILPGRSWRASLGVVAACLVMPLPVWAVIWKSGLVPFAPIAGTHAALAVWGGVSTLLHGCFRGWTGPPAEAALAAVKTSLAISGFMVSMELWQWFTR